MPTVEKPTPGDVTRLLHAVGDGDTAAFDRLMPLVYDELRRLARYVLRGERAGHTLDTTGLVHEAYLKLAGQAQVDWHGRAHFFSIAARAMRQILVDHARRRQAQKRGGERERVTLSDGDALALDVDWAELLDLDAALHRLADLDERLHTVVEFRFFGGMTEEEVAGVLDVSKRTVQRDWRKARAWLYRELYDEPPPASSS